MSHPYEPYGTPPGAPTPPPAYPPAAQAAASHVQERPFAIGLLLAVVTLGIYHLYWHYKTHDELGKQTGVEAKGKGIWIAYGIVWAVGFALGQALQFLPSGATVSTEPTLEEVLAYLALIAPYLALLLALSVAQIVLFILFVSKQWDVVRDAKASMGLRLRASKGTFFGLYYGSWAIVLFLFWLIVPLLAPLIMIPIAYFHLQENYNDIARAIRHGQVDPYRYAPHGSGWTSGPPQTPHPFLSAPAGETTSSYTAPTNHPATTQPYYGSPFGGGQPTSWDVPANDPPYSGQAGGFALHEREPAQAQGSGPLVEQTFQCPRCHAHVVARGPPGDEVTMTCHHCGNKGQVTLPEL